ncbi:uncharacterized protein LOC144691869 [Cetorhinus maximus]
MNAFKLSSIWQENFSKLFSSNKSVEEDNPTKNTSETESPKDNQTAVSPKDGKIDEQTPPGSATKLFTDLAKVSQGSVDQEKSSAQEKPTPSEPISAFPLNSLNQPEGGIRQKLGSFFNRAPKSKPDQPPLSQSERVNSPGLNAENQDGAQVSNWNDDAEKEPHRKHITLLDSDAGENGRGTLETSYPESAAAEQIFAPAESLEQNKPEIAHPKAIGINSSTSGQYKGSGRSEEKRNGSACVTDPTGLQKLRIFSGSISLEEDVGALRSDKDAVYQKTLMKLQTVVGECKEINSQALEDGANEADSSENEQNMPVPPTITYSTYRGARRIKRRRSLRKTFQPVNPTISEVDEKIVVSLVDQPLLNQLKEETNHCVLLQAPTMTKIQTPLEEKIPLINHGKGNAELQPRICTATFPSSKPGLVKDVKTENEPLKQQSSFSGVSGEIELTGPHHRETAKVGSECSTVTTGTMDSTKKQVSVSNTISVQKITAVNPDGTPFPGITMTLEDSHSKGGGVLEKDTQCFVQKDNLIADHNDQSHKGEDNADITTSKLTPETEGSSKTTIMMNPQQKLHVPPASKTISKKGNETDVPKMHCSTVDADEAAAAQYLKLVSLNHPTSLTETNQQADNTDRQQRSIVANLEDQSLTDPVVIASKQDDMEKKIEKTESVSKNEKQGPMLEILDNATVPTKVVSLTDPVKAIHLSNTLDAPKVILDKYAVQLEIASRTQTNGHITESGTFAVFNNKGDIPDASTNDMPKEYKDKDNVTGLSTESLTTDTGYAIKRPPKEYHQTLRRKSVPDIIHVNEESSSQVLKKHMSTNSSTLTTVEVINKTRNEDTVTSANVINESTGAIESDKHPKIPSAAVSKIATDTAPSAMQSFGVSNPESTITTEFQEIAEASNLETENSLYIQKPDQLFKISSEKEHDHSSDSLPGTLACLLEPKVSRAVKPSLPNESIFYRYYQESIYFLLDSDKNTHSIANSEIVTVPAVKQNQSFEEVQDNKKASNFVAMPKDASESSMGTSKCSLSENSLWYRCFQQSTGLLNKRESTQPNTSSETNLGNTQTDENVQLIKPIALVANFTKEAIQSTLQGDALNNSRMTCSSEQNEESEKKTKSYDNKDSDATISGQTEGEETALKTKERKELITLQSRPQLIKEICVVDASQAHPVERVIITDSNNILEGKTKEVEEEIISSARQGTPHTQMSTTVIKEDVTNTQTDSDITKTARLVDTEDADLNESTKNVIMNNTIKEEHEEFVKTVQVTDEGLKGMVHPEVPVESENNSIYIAGGKSPDSPLVTHGNVAEYVPSIHRADEKATSFIGLTEPDNEILQMEPHEESRSSAPFLPVDTDLTPVHAVKDVTNQEAEAGLLNLTSTSQATGNTESTLKTIEVKVNDVQVKAQDPAEETEQRTELRNIVIAAEDSLSETPSEIMKTDNKSDHTAQVCSATVIEQCNIIDPTQSTAVLKTDSINSAHAQEHFMSDFEQSLKTSEASNFQSGSIQLKVSLSGLLTDQGDSTNQTTKCEEGGTCMLSETPRNSNISLSDSVKPVTGVAKTMMQKVMLSSLEAITNIQVPDGAQMSSLDTEPATESNMTLPSASKSAVGLVDFTGPVTPHTQSGSTVSLEDVTTAETASDIIKTDRLMDRPKEIGLIDSTNNLPMNSSIEEELEKLVKTVEVNGERVKEVVHSEIPEESENTLKYIAGGKSQGSSLVTHGNLAKYVPSIHRADEKDVSITMEPHEESRSSAPFLPVDTDLTPVHAVKDVTNQEAEAGLLNPTSTSQATGNTESALKTIEVKVNDVQVKAQDLAKGAEQRTELRNIVIAAEDSLSETPSEIMKTDNKSDHTAQVCSATVIEQCNIIDPTQSTAVLKTDSINSAHAQEHFMSDFGQCLKTSEASNFQSGSIQLKVSLSGLLTDQGDSTNQTTKCEEGGTCMLSETPRNSNISLSDSVKSVTGVAKTMMQKVMLSSLEAITNIQVTDGAQMSSTDTEPATESNMTLPSASKSAVGLVAFTGPVTPHTQSGSTVSLEDVTTAETASDLIKTDRLMDRPKEIGLIDSTNNLPMNITVEEEPEELVKTVEVNGERVKEVVHSEIPEESENTLKYIAGGKSQDSPLVTHGNVAEYVPSIHRADEKATSFIGVIESDNEILQMEPHEESRSSAPFLPVDTDLTPVHAVKDVTNQEAEAGLLNLTSTSQATGNTESTLKTIEVKVNDVQVKAQDPAEETEQRTELRNIVIAAEDSLSETPSEIMKTDNKSDHTAQVCSATVIEQCNIIDPTQSTAVLKTDSINSAHAQEHFMSDFEQSLKTSEASNFQSGSIQLKVSLSGLLTDQGDSTNQTTKCEEGGTCMLSETPRNSNISLSDSVKPVTGVAKTMMQKVMLSSLEAITNIQVTDGAQMSSSDTEPATESNMTLPSASKSAVGLVAFTGPVTPHTQSGSTVSLEDVTTAETASDIIKTDRLMDRPKEIGLIDSTNNLPMNSSIEEELEELVKTVEVNGERVKEVIHSEIPEESENTLKYIAGGKSQDSPLETHGNLAKYVPSIHRADEKDVSITMEPHEESRSSAPFLPVDTDLTPVHAVKDVTNQEAEAGLLNPTSTSQATGNTESTLKTIEVKVNDVQVKAQDPAEETEQRTELRNIVIAAEDSLSETPSEIMKTDNKSDHTAQKCSATVIEQCNIIDPTQSTAVLKTDSINSAQSNDVQENLIAAFEKSKSSQLTDPGDLANVSMKNAEEDETGRIAEPQATFDILFAYSANSLNDHVTKSIETIDHHLNMEEEMEPQFLEQEALILDTSLSHYFNRRQIYPFALSPIYEEQELENDATLDTYSITHSPTSTMEYNSNQLVASILEPTAASLHLMQTEHIFQEIEEEENPTSHVPALEASTSLSSDHLDKATLISQEINEKQNLSSQLQTETCVVDSKASPKPPAAEDSVFYRYFQSSRHYLSKVEKALPEIAPKILTHLQQKLTDDSNLLKCSPDSKCLVKNKNLKINPRPGKVVIYDQLNFLGNKREIFTDVSDATSWNFFEGISLKVVRGCWMLCEKPDFQGQTYVLEEGYRELDDLWVDKSLRMEFTPTKLVIGSIKRIVKNHCIPEIAIFQEPQQDDIKTYLHSEVTCLEECGISPSVSSIIVNSGIWLAYYQANFSGRYTLLETDNSPVPLTAEIKSDNIKSLRPLEMGGLKVERPMAPQVIVFEKTFFNGRVKELCEDASDLKNLWEDVTDLNINGFRGVGSVRVIGGLWVCYEKECYRGHQYLLEEGEYEDWQAWGGFNSTVQSMRYIQADYMKPEITLFEEADLKKGNNIFVIHAIPNLESIGYGTVTRSIEVKNGAWVAYRQEHYSGEQYILEKGVYRNYQGWGGDDSSIMSIRPIQLEPLGGNEVQFKLQAYNGINFQGESVEFVTEIPSLPSLQPNSFKVHHGCWVLYDEKDYSGCQYVLEEGQYPDLDSLGCLSAKPIQSLKPIKNDFSMPSISLFSLYSFEGQQLNLTEGTNCWKDKGYYNIPKSIKVKAGIWIAYEHANFRGNQLLLECTEITNWNKFSGWETIGSVHPLKQPRVYFRIKNKATGGFMTAVGDSKDPRESKLSVCPYNGKTTQMWFYCNGLIKSKANSACIDVIGGQEKAGAKVTLWTEHGRTDQKWNINRDGSISSFLDSNLRLDIKGGDFYDKDHIIVNFPGEPQQTQFWDIEVLI